MRLWSVYLGWRLLGSPPRPSFPPGQRHPWRVPARTVYVGDHEVPVRLAGPEGGPPLLLLHGLGGSSIVEWYPVGSRLADRFRLVMPDHRNHGLARRTVERFEIADLADDAAGTLATLGIGPVTVVGFSMGGAVAQELARRHPHLVDGLVLVAPYANPSPAARVLLRIGVALVRAWERLTGLGTPEVRAAYLIASGAVAPEHRAFVWEESHRRDPEGGAVAAWALLRFDSSGWVGRLDVPTMVIVPTADQLVPPMQQYRLAAGLHRVEVVELVDARHEAPWTHADQIAEAISRFAASSGGRVSLGAEEPDRDHDQPHDDENE